MPTPTSQPLAQVRIIAGVAQADKLVDRLVAYARTLYGPDATYRAQHRAARRAGHIGVYLTITRKEHHAAPDD